MSSGELFWGHETPRFSSDQFSANDAAFNLLLKESLRLLDHGSAAPRKARHISVKIRLLIPDVHMKGSVEFESVGEMNMVIELVPTISEYSWLG